MAWCSLVLTELHPGVTVDDIRAKTGAPFDVALEIENAIRSLSAAERNKLVQHIPQLFPEFGGDSEWERIANNDRPRPALTELLNRYEADLARDSNAIPKVAENDFDSRA